MIFALIAVVDGIAGEDKTGAADSAAQTSGYESRAGAILGAYQPGQPDHSPENMARAANRFLAALNDAQRQSAQSEL